MSGLRRGASAETVFRVQRLGGKKRGGGVAVFFRRLPLGCLLDPRRTLRGRGMSSGISIPENR
jgi:hypothetical protein